MIKKQIIASGGGGFMRRNSRLLLERYIIALAGKSNPSICFLPQASSESPEYVSRFFEVFTHLNTKPCWVSLFGRVEPSWKDKILSADIVYVGGGNTRSMLALWREWGVDTILSEAYNKGVIMSGTSAGALCWFEQAVTDSVWPLGVISGLGFIAGSCCPHFDSEKERRPSYERMLSNGLVVPGIALEDDTAAYFVDGALHTVLQSEAGKSGFYCAPGTMHALPSTALF